MHSSIIFAILAATSAFAAPQAAPADNEIRISLKRDSSSRPATTVFTENPLRQSSGASSSGPFEFVELNLGAGVVQKDLRCQLVAFNGDGPIKVVRNGVEDITFGDGGAGPWKLVNGPQDVVSIDCDPKFKKGAAAGAVATGGNTDIKVTLADLSKRNVKIDVDFEEAGLEREAHRVRSDKEYTSVLVTLGEGVTNQALRCKVLDHNGNRIEAKRGVNVDTTFAGGAAGKWDFIKPQKSKVSKVVCDPAFVKAVQA